MRVFSPLFLMTLTAVCVSLLPTAYTVLGWKFESGEGLQESEQLGLQSWVCNIADGMVTDVHINVQGHRHANVLKQTYDASCTSY